MDGCITRLVEKPEHPTSNLAVVGLYYIRNTPLLLSCLNDVVAKDIRTKGEYQLTDVLQMMIDRGERMETSRWKGGTIAGSLKRFSPRTVRCWRNIRPSSPIEGS